MIEFVSAGTCRRVRSSRIALGVSLLVCLLVFMLCPQAMAEQESSVAPSLERRYLRTPTAKDYPQSDSVVVRDEISLTVAADGSSVVDEIVGMKVLTEKGIAENSRASKSYDASCETAEVVMARVITPAGLVIPVADKAIDDVAVVNGSELLSSARAKTIAFSDLDVNSIVEYQFRISRKAGSGYPWSSYSYFDNVFPCLKSVFTVSVPSGTALNWKSTSSQDKPRISKNNGQDVYVWECSDGKCMGTAAITAQATARFRHVDVSSFPSWDAYAQSFAKLWQAKKETSADLDSKFGLACMRTVSAVAPTEEKIRALSSYVSGHYGVRDAGTPVWSLNSVADSFAADTVSYDDAMLLLSAMLDRVGVSNYPVLVSALRQNELSAACPADNNVNFGLALAVPVYGKETLWITPDTLGSAVTYLPDRMQGVGALCVKSPATPVAEFLTTPVCAAERNYVVIQTEGSVGAFGNGEMSLEFTSDGPAFSTVRSLVASTAEMVPAERSRVGAYVVDTLNAGFSAKSVAYSHFFPEQLVAGKPLTFQSNVVSAALAKPAEQANTFSVPLVLYNDVSLGKPSDYAGRNRLLVYLGAPLVCENTVHVVLPKGAELLPLPQSISLDNSVGSIYVTVRSQDNEYWAYVRRTSKVAWVDASKMSDMAAFAEAWNKVLNSKVSYKFVKPASASSQSEKIERPTDSEQPSSEQPSTVQPSTEQPSSKPE